MIYMEPQQLGWSPLRDSYMNTLPESLSTEHRELVRLQTCCLHGVIYSNKQFLLLQCVCDMMCVLFLLVLSFSHR